MGRLDRYTPTSAVGGGLVRILMVASALALLVGCASTTVEVTPVPGKTFTPLAENAPLRLWLSPKHSADTIEALYRDFGELELVSRPRGTRVGEVTVVHGPRLERLHKVMAEARKLGGNALYFPDQAVFAGARVTAQVYRSRR